MHAELFTHPMVIARYRAGPYAEARERFLRKVHAEGYSRSTLQRMASMLLVAAHATHRNGGRLNSERLKTTLVEHMERRLGAVPSAHTVKLLLCSGQAWLRSMNALSVAKKPPARFDREMRAFAEHMRTERGLSAATIANRQHLTGQFFKSLPSHVCSVAKVTLDQIDAFLRGEAKRGWSRRSLRQLGSSLRSFFRFAAGQGWCSPTLAFGIELPRLYDLEDVPRAPAVEDVDRLLAVTAVGKDAAAVRDHAILLLLVHYGLRRGEVEQLSLDDLDWKAETIRVQRRKSRQAQTYPLLATVGEAILRYLRDVRPRCAGRALFVTLRPPYRALSGDGISMMVHRRLAEQGVKLDRFGAHCLRHACAGQLLDAGFTIKQIADHLGHRSMDSTRIYTKIDLRGLRQVAELDLGALL
jgi:site-specific recombinase XerD